MTAARIVSFRHAVEPHHSVPEPDRLLDGDPQLSLWNHYSDGTQQFHAGVWAATRGTWRVHYTEHEFCHILSGRVVIASEAERVEFGPGDSFVVPAGFVGTWEVVADCRKLYALFEPAKR